jgi:hypothetical protein
MEPMPPHDSVPPDLQVAANGIKIIHEVSPRSAEFREARAALRDAKRIIFLGFGFDRRNVQRLSVFERNLRGVAIFGTGIGLSGARKARIHRDVFHGYTNEQAFDGTSIRRVLEAAHLTFVPTR